jgi:aspartyl protease family protein
MKFKLLLLTVLSCINGFTQELTVDETMNYINSKIGSVSRKLELKPGGEFIFTEYLADFWFDRANLTTEEMNNRIKNNNYKMLLFKTATMSINEINFRNKGFIDNLSNADFCTTIFCKSGGCIYEKTFNKFGQQISSNNVNDLDLTFNTKDTNDKMYNALRYLISLAKNDDKYQKFDNDPFANKNFQESNNIISTNNKSNKIQLTSDGGVYKIWVEISGIRKSFVLDTGASEISISQNVENELISKNLLQKMDYVEPALYKIADGSIVLCRRVKLKQVKVGNIIVKNVIASIGVSETPLLLGKNFLDNFQKWSIDNKTKILTLEN